MTSLVNEQCNWTMRHTGASCCISVMQRFFFSFSWRPQLINENNYKKIILHLHYCNLHLNNHQCSVNVFKCRKKSWRLSWSSTGRKSELLSEWQLRQWCKESYSIIKAAAIHSLQEQSTFLLLCTVDPSYTFRYFLEILRFQFIIVWQKLHSFS